MKKITKFLSLIISAIILVACPATAVAGVSAADETVNYTADFSGGVPSDWAAYSNGDGKGYVEEGDNGIVVVHNNGSANAGNYYGGIFEIATGIGNVRDFELVMDFNFVQWNNDSRWFGVLYHTQKNSSNKLEGYMMNLRANGESAQSSVTTVPSFTDTERVSCGKTLTDKKTHTLKITVENGIATHYVDDFKLISYALESKYALMSGVLVDGGFAFIANNCSVQITSLTIKGTKGGDKPTKVKADETLADTYASATSLVVAPSVVATVKNQEDINALLEDVIPATAIFSVDDEMNVVDENGENLGAFDDIYTNVLVGKIIPAIYVRSEAQVNGFLNYLATIRNLLDIAVVSDDAEFVAYARKSNTKIRGIVDYSNKNLKAEDIPNVVSESNVSGANIVIFNEESATRANVTYAHSRF